MQEVVVRGEPFCMLSLSPDEIIAKIKKPPPLIRPSVCYLNNILGIEEIDR